MMCQHNALIDRAYRAYCRYPDGIPDQPAWGQCEVLCEEDKWYVVLRNGHRTLAVYRVTRDEALRRLKRWPRSLDLDYEAIDLGRADALAVGWPRKVG